MSAVTDHAHPCRRNIGSPSVQFQAVLREDFAPTLSKIRRRRGQLPLLAIGSNFCLDSLRDGHEPELILVELTYPESSQKLEAAADSSFHIRAYETDS